MPRAARTPVSRAVSAAPRRSTVSPRPMSVPAKVTWAPGEAGRRSFATQKAAWTSFSGAMADILGEAK